MSRELQDEGYVLHGRPYQETSLLLEVLTAAHGRVGLIARGARRSKSGLAGSLQPFHRLQLRWSPRGELHTLIGAEELDRHRFSAAMLPAALYLNELLMRLLARHEDCPDIYVAYLRALTRLVEGDELEASLRDFELDLLEGLGYGLTLECEAESSDPLDPQASYRYVEQHGPMRVAGSDPGSFSGAALLAMAERDWREPETLRTAKHILRTTLETHLGSRGLRTRDLLGGLARLRRMSENTSSNS